MRELGVVRVATPCRVDWEQMTGDANVRHCGHCNLSVFNLEGLTADEARALFRRQGRLCVRFFVRTDGTILTRDCPMGLRKKLQRRVAAVCTAGALALFTAFEAGGFPTVSAKLKTLLGRPPEPIATAEQRGQKHIGMMANNNDY